MNEESPDSVAADLDQASASTVIVASMPWAFTQHQPLDTSEFIAEAGRRGFDLRLSTLRELYRHGLLAPFMYIPPRPVSEPSPFTEPEPQGSGTRLRQLRWGRDTGRLLDLAVLPFKPRLPFERPKQRSQRWWNRLLYSWYQLLILPEIDDLLAHRRDRWRRGQRVVWLPKPSQLRLNTAAIVRRITIILTALEARYLAKLDPEWLQLTNADIDEWQHYREAFDPIALSIQLGYSTAQARQDAEWLLFRAHRLDPVGDDWSQLMRRAPSKAWKDLMGVALSALDYRIAAEILLLFYEDLADRGQAEPLPDMADMRMGWHPLHERLSYRHETLDQNLMDLGISPHPRVVLAVEGETEQTHVPLVWKDLGYPDAPELMRLLWLEGADKNPVKIAALASAPLISRRAPTQQPAWVVIKPPTRLLIAVDPEGKFFSPQNVGKTRTAILREIRAVLKAQGVDNPNLAELEELIEIRTWSASCYEFAHFNNDELATGIMSVHDDINSWARDQLIEALGYWRDKRTDIKRVWESGRWDEQRQTVTGPWAYKVSKTKLAEALWPTLKAKIDRCRADPDAPVPEIVEVVQGAYLQAQQWRYLSFLLTETPETPETSG